MKQLSSQSTAFFFSATLQNIICQRLINIDRLKDKILRLTKRHHTIIEQCLVLIAIGVLFLAGSYLFFIQLAKYGW